MAWNCDVCGEPIHYRKLENGKIVAIPCTLEEYKTVKSYFSQEFKFLPAQFGDIPLTNRPEDLKLLKKLVPEKTSLSDYTFQQDKVYQVKSMIVSGTLRTFYLHFVRFLIDFYGDNKIHFVESNVVALSHQFNYLWLTGTLLRDCYFRNTHALSSFKTMSDLINPSLLIYALGAIDGIFMKNKGDLLMEVITSRRIQGKPTWIIHTKSFGECEEIKTSENLRLYLTSSSYIPRIRLDQYEEDPEVFAVPSSGATGSSVRRKSKGSTAGAANDPYNLM